MPFLVTEIGPKQHVPLFVVLRFASHLNVAQRDAPIFSRGTDRGHNAT